MSEVRMNLASLLAERCGYVCIVTSDFLTHSYFLKPDLNPIIISK